ncbi:uncharacterized protein V6R79_020430 [Siganus canaliculatus]
MQGDDFVVFLKHFVHHTRPTPESKVIKLLFLCVLRTDVDVLMYGIDFCRENGVVLLSFPPHCSHKLQPLYRTVYRPLKRYISAAIANWTKKNPGTTFGIYDVPVIVNSALPFAATPSNISLVLVRPFPKAGARNQTKAGKQEVDCRTDRHPSEEGLGRGEREASGITEAYPYQGLKTNKWKHKIVYALLFMLGYELLHPEVAKNFVTMEFKANKTSGDVTSSIDGKHNTSGPTMPHVVKKKHRACGLTRGIAPEFNTEYEGVNGYVYTIKYHDGHVTLCVKSVSEEQGLNADLSVKDWKLFRTVACRDLDHPGFPEVLYVSQWSSGSGPEMYRIEADRFLRLSDFIFLSVCEDREPMIASRGREEWKLQPYPLTNQEYDAHFKTSFFIQWCDWGYLQGV